MDSHDLFQLYHRICLTVKNGTPPRNVKDFSKFDASENKPFFDRFVQIAERCQDTLNVELFIRALAEHYKGFFPPKALITQSAMRIYREFISEFSKLEDPDDITKRLYDDCRFVAKFCVDNGISDGGVIEYFHHNEMFIPTVIKHVISGDVSHFFLAACDTFPVIYSAYPEDSKHLLNNFDYKLVRSKLIFIEKCRTISDNLDTFIKMLMKKEIENRTK